MFTDQEIEGLVTRPKRITGREPARGYLEENRQRRCDLQLESMPDGAARFEAFIRQSTVFTENFTVGLRYLNYGSMPSRFNLVRYNGPHGESSHQEDGHYAKSHIHRITASEVNSGSAQPKERAREITDRYSTFESALVVFFQDIGVTNFTDYFPESLQGRMFNEYQ